MKGIYWDILAQFLLEMITARIPEMSLQIFWNPTEQNIVLNAKLICSQLDRDGDTPLDDVPARFHHKGNKLLLCFFKFFSFIWCFHSRWIWTVSSKWLPSLEIILKLLLGFHWKIVWDCKLKISIKFQNMLFCKISSILTFFLTNGSQVPTIYL